MYIYFIILIIQLEFITKIINLYDKIILLLLLIKEIDLENLKLLTKYPLYEINILLKR